MHTELEKIYEQFDIVVDYVNSNTNGQLSDIVKFQPSILDYMKEIGLTENINQFVKEHPDLVTDELRKEVLSVACEGKRLKDSMIR